MTCSLPSCSRLLFTYSTGGRFYTHEYGIQKLKSPENVRSMQISTLWAGLTDTNDMRIDNSRPHRLWTHAHSRSKQTASKDAYHYVESRKKHKRIKVTSGRPNIGYQKAQGCTHTCKLHCTFLKQKELGTFHEWRFICTVYSVQKIQNQKIPRSMQNTTLWPSLTNTNDMRMDNSRQQQVWTSAQFCFK